MKRADDVRTSKMMLVALMVLSPAWLILGAFIGHSWGDRPGAHDAQPGRIPIYDQSNQNLIPNDSTNLLPCPSIQLPMD